MENTTTQIEATSTTLDKMKAERMFTERVINDPVWGFEAKTFKEVALIDAIKEHGAKKVVINELNVLASAVDRASDDWQLISIVSMVQTLTDDGRTEQLYTAIKQAFPEFFY
jgi:hypothetical protein